MTGLYLTYLLLQSANGLAIVPGGNRRYSRVERTGFLDALDLHVFQKLMPTFCFFEEIKNRLGLGIVYRSSGSVVVIPDNHDVEDVADNVAAEKRIGAPDCLDVRLATCCVQRRR